MTATPAMEHPAWLPPAAFEAVGRQTIEIDVPRSLGDSPVLASLRREIEVATREYGGAASPGPAGADRRDQSTTLRFEFDDSLRVPGSYTLASTPAITIVAAGDANGLLYGWFAVVRVGESAFGENRPAQTFIPATGTRMLDHWYNVDVHPVLGQVERGYSGGALWFEAGHLRDELSRVGRYARLLASVGINHVCVNNVNVHPTETTLLTTRLDWVVRLADIFRAWGIATHVAVNFESPVALGGLTTSDPCDAGVRAWWAETTRRVYDAIPDFGGYVVKADSEGQPGPFAYGRSHADGANCLAAALAPFGGTVHWRAFVYNHRQDWRDRHTDRARAAYDHFTPLDGQFADNVMLQVKFGPLDFQVREPLSPLLAAMPRTRVGIELQVTQEYTGQQRHIYYLPEQWHEVLDWRPWAGDDTIADIATGSARAGEVPSRPGLDAGIIGVSNAGADEFWTGHPLAQANLYGFGRLAWDPSLRPAAILDEWSSLTFPGADPLVPRTLRSVMLGSRQIYEDYTAPLGVCFMVTPGVHYGPSVDGYEYSPWGTYHFADRDGIGVDRTRATGSGYTGQYHRPWTDIYESLAGCPDELLLFFHHVPYDHVLRGGKTVVQHVYDTHFAGVAAVERMRANWRGLAGLVDAALFARVDELLDEQVRCAGEWRDQLTTYFWRHSGIPDAQGRPLY
ncbi:MAG: alpha-glucuronidase [Micrococcales bacterium]|nr:alpha-glucuronidase [Micrococcales bacterium]